MRQYQIGFVLYGVHLEYLQPLRYSDADTLTISASARVRQGGAQLENLVDFTSEGRSVARLRTVSVTLWLEDSEESSAVPATMGPDLIGLYQPDEIDPVPYRCPVAEMADAVAASGRPIGSHQHPITLHRHQCEFLDQWFFVESLNFCSASRESLVLARGRERPELRKGLALPIQKIELTFTRPVFLFDEIRVNTQAYAVDGGVAFVHRLTGATGDVLHSTVVERL